MSPQASVSLARLAQDKAEALKRRDFALREHHSEVRFAERYLASAEAEVAQARSEVLGAEACLAAAQTSLAKCRARKSGSCGAEEAAVAEAGAILRATRAEFSAKQAAHKACASAVASINGRGSGEVAALEARAASAIALLNEATARVEDYLQVQLPGAGQPESSVLAPGGGLAAEQLRHPDSHIVDRHVQSEMWVADRLFGRATVWNRWTNQLDLLPAKGIASSFYDRTIAERSVAQVLDFHRTDVVNWLLKPANSQGAKKTEIDYTFQDNVGFILTRQGQGYVRNEGSKLRVVLWRDDGNTDLPFGFFIKTVVIGP